MVGLSLNATKAKIIGNGPKKNINVEREIIDEVDETIYLGQKISFKK